MRQFLALLSSEALTQLKGVFDKNKDDEALLLDSIRVFLEAPSKSELELSADGKDLALLHIVIEKGGIRYTPFKRWASFETFVIELLSGNLLKAVFFKECELSTMRQFLALLSSEALTQLKGVFDKNKDD